LPLGRWLAMLRLFQVALPVHSQGKLSCTAFRIFILRVAMHILYHRWNRPYREVALWSPGAWLQTAIR